MKRATRRMSLTFAATCVALVVSIIAAGHSHARPVGSLGGGSAAPSGQAWDLATDYGAHPDQNPGPDGYGDPSVWYKLHSAHRVQRGFGRMRYYTSSYHGIAGVDAWHGHEVTCGGALPELGVNTNGNSVLIGTECSQGVQMPAHAVFTHPLPNVRPAAGWRSPIAGTVNISGGIEDANPYCGNGVRWSVRLNAALLAHGSIPNGGHATLPPNLTATVRQGDFVYFGIGAAEHDFLCDSTLMSLTIAD